MNRLRSLILVFTTLTGFFITFSPAQTQGYSSATIFLHGKRGADLNNKTFKAYLTQEVKGLEKTPASGQ